MKNKEVIERKIEEINIGLEEIEKKWININFLKNKTYSINFYI